MKNAWCQVINKDLHFDLAYDGKREFRKTIHFVPVVWREKEKEKV